MKPRWSWTWTWKVRLFLKNFFGGWAGNPFFFFLLKKIKHPNFSVFFVLRLGYVFFGSCYLIFLKAFLGFLLAAVVFYSRFGTFLF